MCVTEFGSSGSQFKARNIVDEFNDFREHYYAANPKPTNKWAFSFMRDFVQTHEFIGDDEKFWVPRKRLQDISSTPSLRNGTHTPKAAMTLLSIRLQTVLSRIDASLVGSITASSILLHHSIKPDSEWPVLAHAFLAINLHLIKGSKILCILLSPPVVHEIEMMEDQQNIFEYLEPLLELFRVGLYKVLPPIVDFKVTK
ncbi:hypothetical protein BU24DRAFT_412392 [Aaosphaeria arxii CBS 175.79]|uniref:Uncharacterized protein n=1 Tax=Aaosphaeria arxii CBS 175.79 TaxID=1450172 RepID=A0A6A5XG69_9PLEO|nr:uncharacterized protein BU24DRAFT_412392 [Aaosphaeria arxii CBS 175.79]KAF2011827.1 hypothetical protein BU24DRAFT_412392 [Aaosphaeria arxii CBS 175.79]